MSFGGSLRAAALAVLFVFGFSVSVLGDGPLWNQTGQFAPIAYTNYSSYGYLIYGNTNSSDNSQVWLSAELTCQALGGHLTSVSSATEGTVVYNLWQHLTKNGGKQFGNSTMCAWTGLHNLNGAMGWTDDASLAYLNSTVATNPIKNASFFSDWTSCAAVCGDAIYIRDCDFEPQAFVCKLPSTATPFLGTAANVPAPSNPNTPVYPPAYSSPSPSYPPTYSSPSPSPAYSSPSPSPSPAYPSPSPSPSPAYPPAYGGNVWPNGVIPSCMFFNGYKYCAAAAGVQNAYSWTNAEYYCHLAGAGSLASITSLAELGAILAFFVPNSTAPAFWTGGFKAPFYPAVNIDGNNTWLSAQKSIADPTAGYKMPETYLSHYQLTSYNGSCLNGHGCGVALTYNARGASAPGLQYIDPAFPAWSICKAPYQLVPAPLPPANINATQRAPGEQYVIVPVNVKMQMNSIGCKAMLNNIAGFKYSYKQAAQTSWNNANPTIPIQVGDTDVADPVAACLRRSMGRRLMQATSSSADVNSGSGMNSGVSTTQAAANSGSFQGNMGSNLGPGSSFANQFGVTGVTVSVQAPYTATNGGTSSSSNSSVALGVGLGIGLGVPLLVCLALAVFLIRKRRHNQEVSQGNAGAAEAPLVGEGQGQQQ